MVRESNATTTDKVPGLGDVPVVGNLFKNKTTSSSRIERMFLITPRLAGVRPDATGASLRTAAATPAQAAPANAPSAPAAVASAASSAPAAAPAPAPAPVVAAPAPRASVVLDLDALPAGAAPPVRPGVTTSTR
jgi:type III secretion protein C